MAPVQSWQQVVMQEGKEEGVIDERMMEEGIEYTKTEGVVEINTLSRIK